MPKHHVCMQCCHVVMLATIATLLFVQASANPTGVEQIARCLHNADLPAALIYRESCVEAAAAAAPESRLPRSSHATLNSGNLHVTPDDPLAVGINPVLLSSGSGTGSHYHHTHIYQGYRVSDTVDLVVHGRHIASQLPSQLTQRIRDLCADLRAKYQVRLVLGDAARGMGSERVWLERSIEEPEHVNPELNLRLVSVWANLNSSSDADLMGDQESEAVDTSVDTLRVWSILFLPIPIAKQTSLAEGFQAHHEHSHGASSAADKTTVEAVRVSVLRDKDTMHQWIMMPTTRTWSQTNLVTDVGHPPPLHFLDQEDGSRINLTVIQVENRVFPRLEVRLSSQKSPCSKPFRLPMGGMYSQEDWDLSLYRPCNVTQVRQFRRTYGVPQELSFSTNAREVLLAAAERLNKAQTEWFLNSGTLLGWLRECAIFAHGKDVDVGVLLRASADHQLIVNSIMQAMQQDDSPFTFLHRLGKLNYGLELSWMHQNGVKLDMFFFYEDHAKQVVWNGGTQVKSGKRYRYEFPPFLRCRAELLGVPVFIPCNTEAHVEANYGLDWRTVVTEWDWKTSPANVQEDGAWLPSEMDEAIQQM